MGQPHSGNHSPSQPPASNLIGRFTRHHLQAWSPKVTVCVCVYATVRAHHFCGPQRDHPAPKAIKRAPRASALSQFKDVVVQLPPVAPWPPVQVRPDSLKLTHKAAGGCTHAPVEWGAAGWAVGGRHGSSKPQVVRGAAQHLCTGAALPPFINRCKRCATPSILCAMLWAILPTTKLPMQSRESAPRTRGQAHDRQSPNPTPCSGDMAYDAQQVLDCWCIHAKANAAKPLLRTAQVGI